MRRQSWQSARRETACGGVPWQQARLGVAVLILTLSVLAGWSAFVTPAVGAAGGLTITVTSTADTQGNTNICTLRDAVAAANAQATVGGCAPVADPAGSGTVITFALPSGQQTITLDATLFPTAPLTLRGPGAALLTIRRDTNTVAKFRLFNSTGDLTIEGLTLSGGDAREQSGFSGGGALLVSGNVTITDSVISGNTASSNFPGGGFFTGGNVTVTGSTFSNNAAGYGAGFYTSGNATVTGSTFSNNIATAQGGGFVGQFAVTVTGSTFSGNTAGAGAGGGFLTGLATLTVTDTTFTSNTAGQGGGFQTNSPVTVTGSTFNGNTASDSGGGFFTYRAATVTGSTLNANTAAFQGGGFLAGGTATVTGSTLSTNTASSQGGGFYGYGIATVTASTLVGNTATTAGGGFVTEGTATVTGSTLSTNSATYAGGFYAPTGATVAGSTLVGNNAQGAGGAFLTNGTATVTNNVVVGGSGLSICSATTLADNGGVIADSATCVNGGAGSRVVADAGLLPLAANGGPTQTYALRGDSPARGAGAAADCAARPTDQRGVPRPASGCDSGAYQTVQPPLVVTPAALPGGTVGTSYSQTLVASGGTAPYTYAVTAGTLPAGLTLDGAGALSGTPTAAGTFAFTATATDALGYSASQGYSVTIAPAPVTVTASVQGGGTVSPAGATAYAPGSLATYSATPASGQLFLGWTLDGTDVGFASPLAFTVNGDRTLVARFAPRPAFGDVPGGTAQADAIAQLAARGIIKGYSADECAARGLAAPCFGPADPVARAQIAALIVRAFGWDTGQPSGPAPFADLDGVDPELQRAIAILAQRGIAQGYGDGTYGPADRVTHAQAISLIARSMVQAGYWQQVTAAEDDGSMYPNVTASSGHRYDLLTFVKYAGAIPERPATADWQDWQTPGSRGWTAQVLWQALSSQFGVDRVP